MKMNLALRIGNQTGDRQNELHGLFAGGFKTQPRLYRIWRAMRCRCNSHSYDGYHLYGGRGIRVCQEWDSFTAFAEWALSNGYADHLSIDRKEVDGHYEPSNCRWATDEEQSANKRNSCLVEINGVTKTVAAWSGETGIHLTTLYRRYKRGLTGPAFIEPTTPRVRN